MVMGTVPLVSIVTPTYNRASYLRETVDSVLGQTYKNIEYIVLDDGSSDNTHEVLESYAGRLLWESHPNVGESQTVNKGWNMVHGDYVMFVNSDDPILPDLVEQLVGFMQANPDILMAYPDWSEIDEHSRPIRNIQAWDYDYLDMVRYCACIPGPGALICGEKLTNWNQDATHTIVT